MLKHFLRSQREEFNFYKEELNEGNNLLDRMWIDKDLTLAEKKEFDRAANEDLYPIMTLEEKNE